MMLDAKRGAYYNLMLRRLRCVQESCDFNRRTICAGESIA